jgi:hypothetical protein
MPLATGSTSPTGVASAVRLKSPPASASPTPALTPSVFGTCRLPVGVSGNPPTVGWLELPSGRYSPDPTSVGHQSPINSAIAWDPGVGGWVATDPQYVSPDGTDYVAPIDSSTIKIIDARTGATVSKIPTQSPYINTVIAYTRTAIYLVATGESPPPGLWKIDTSSWKLSQVSADRINWDVADGAAVWGTYDTPDSLSRVERLNLSTGVVTELSPASQTSLYVVGFVGSGVLAVNAIGPFSAARVINPDGSSQSVQVPAALNGALLNPWVLQDGQDLLFAFDVGLVAYDPDLGFQVVLSTQNLFRVLGPCTAA